MIFNLLQLKMMVVTVSKRSLLTCLHDQNKNGFVGGLVFIQPIKCFWILFKWLDWL